MGPVGARPAREVLPHHRTRTKAARRADRRLGPLRRRGLARAARHMNPFNRVFWRPRVEEEVDEELAFHLEMRTRDLVARGLDPAAARREAERRFGNVPQMRRTLRALGGERNQHMARTQYLGE